MSDDAYTWTYLDAAGAPLAEASSPSFPSQAEAEAWFAEEWQVVKDGGADSVTLMRGTEVVYGPMSLQSMAG
ncbi:hypothetical protein [Arsenicicoccus dermatophilus]|uniref:hypothetical protein n=1 Tax=Arsenicicoccus dermatophilus TaxID=1076331 RepID=UPI001F4D1082|nr:hypothetical protein [Arsenicicoccus dermatophilus]MCH8612686.1 hypothetical protein [Arsenicicoccus dermatophilus]